MIKTPVPVTILTGFLGCGKTTFLNEWIAYNRPRKLAVIENEFGDIPIDGELVMNADSNVFTLADGCLCCSLSGDMIRLLEDLLNQEESFDELMIETTGIADPAGIAAPFLLTIFWKSILLCAPAFVWWMPLSSLTSCTKPRKRADKLLLQILSSSTKPIP